MTMMNKTKLVIFDLDETIVHNQIPFAEMRERIMKRLGISTTPPHLFEFLRGLGDDALKILQEEEIRRAKSAEVDPEFDRILKFLKERKIKVAVLTRNSRAAAEIALGDYVKKIDALLCRDDGLPPKPAPDGVIYLLNRFSASPEGCIMVGDYDYDIMAARRAGCIAVRLGEGNGDLHISSLSELIPLLTSLNTRLQRGKGYEFKRN